MRASGRARTAGVGRRCGRCDGSQTVPGRGGFGLDSGGVFAASCLSSAMLGPTPVCLTQLPTLSLRVWPMSARAPCRLRLPGRRPWNSEPANRRSACWHRGFDAGRSRRRFRRHRNRPTVCAADRLSCRSWRRSDVAVGGLRGDLARLLGGDDHRFDQVRDLHHARRQRWRGRHHGAHRLDPASRAGKPFGQDRARGAGDLRGGAVLRRRHDHARHLGALGRRGSSSRRAVSRLADLADRLGHLDRAVCHPALRHRGRRAVLRSCDGPVVRRSRRRRPPRKSPSAPASFERCRRHTPSNSSSSTAARPSSPSGRSCWP